MASHTETVDDRFGAGDVPSGGTEGFCESSHENVDFGGVDTEVVGNATAVWAKCTDGMSFVDI